MKILVHGAGLVNKGGEAMIRTLLTEIGLRVPAANFFSFAPHDHAASMRAAGIHLISDRRGKLRERMARLYSILANPRLAARSRRSIRLSARLRRLEGMSAMLDISGFALGDAWGRETVDWHHLLVSYFADRGLPCVYLPQAWGPFTDPEAAKAVADLCQRVAMAYARDTVSYHHLCNLPGAVEAKIAIASDIAFKFKGDPPDVGERVLRKLGIGPERKPIVGITPNMRVYERTPGDAHENAYVGLLSAVARLCKDRLGASVMLIPHEIAESSGVRDDRYLCGLIQEAAGIGESAAAMMGDHSAAEIKSVIGRLDLLFGCRYHSIIAALSQRVPVVSLGWSHKYDELMRDAGGEDYACDYRSADHDSLFGLIERAWHSRESLRDVLESTVPELERSAEGALDHAAEILLGSARVA